MAVDIIHEDYSKILEDWELLEDIYTGEKAVKKAGTKYLPILSGQSFSEYNSYKERGSFFNTFYRTIKGLEGSVNRKKPFTNFPEKVEALSKSIMSTGQSFDVLNRKTLLSVLKFGRVGLLIDSVGNSEPYIAIYGPKSITYWDTQFKNGEEVITLLILKEDKTIYGDSAFDAQKVTQYRSFELLETGVVVKIWQQNSKKDWEVIDTIFPKIRGKALDKIMFFPIGAESNTIEPNKPPLIDLAYVSINHWRLSVDYSHSLHWVALPTPYAFGDFGKETLKIGPGKIIRSADTDAKCGFLEFEGKGLDELSKALETASKNMAILGARMLESQRATIETAETARIRQSGESGALITIVKNVSAGLTEVMKSYTYWVGQDETDISVELNTDFISAMLTAQEITSLLTAYQVGGMSLDTLLYNFNKGELHPPEISIEDEKAKIEEKDDDFRNDVRIPEAINTDEEEE